MTDPLLSVGVPREIKPFEKRVALTPVGVAALCREGIPVFIEKGAGAGSGFSDEAYKAAGGFVVSSARALYQKASVIKKVKEPLPSEWKHLRSQHLLFCFLHLASPQNCDLLLQLLEKRLIGIGLELVEKEGRTLCLEPMSRIAGALAVLEAWFFKRYVRVERGAIVYPARLMEKLELLAQNFPDLPERLSPGKVLIFGGGVAGESAARTVLKMGGDADLIEKNPQRRSLLRTALLEGKEKIRIWGVGECPQSVFTEAEVWIGAVHQAGEQAHVVMSKEEMAEYSKERQRLILDIAIDEGGNFPESRSSTYADPLYLDTFGNLRFGVPNIPSLAGRYASEALEQATLNETQALARNWREALSRNAGLRSGVAVFQGDLVKEGIAKAHRRSWKKLEL